MTAAIAGLVAVAVAFFVALIAAFLDAGSLRGPIERAVAARTGRALAIGGEVEIDLGWRIAIVLNDVRLSNPAWARREHLLEARRVTLVAPLPSLLIGRLSLDELTLEQPKLALERRDDERTWALGGEGSGPAPAIGRLRIDHGTVEYLDRAAQTEITAHVDTSDNVEVSAKGTLRGAPFRLDASGPTIALRALDLQVAIAGDDLAALREIVRIAVPSTPPYELHGRLRRDRAGWHFEDVAGRIGDSDVAATLTYTDDAPRPRLAIDVVSERLDFDDLGPLIGAPPRTTPGETASAEQRRMARQMREAGRALPVKPFDASLWQHMDIDASLVGRKVVHPPALPIESLDARVRARDGILRLDPLELRTAGGRVIAQIELDGRERPLRGAAEVEFRALRLRELFPTIEPMKKARGLAHGRARLTGHGGSVAELLASADGRISLAVDGGTLSNLVLELLGLDAGEAILLFASGDREIALRCAVADLGVRDGIATSDLLVLDTADTLVVGAGVIDLRQETLDLTLYPRPKDVSLLAARTRLNVRGTLRNPQVRPDPKVLATRVVTAAVLALVNPLLALAPFIETGPGRDSDCAQLLAQAKTWAKPSTSRDDGPELKRRGRR